MCTASGRGYRFTERRGVVLTPKSAELLLSREGVFRVPVDFGTRHVEALSSGEEATLAVGSVAVSLRRELLERTLKAEKLLFVSPQEAYFLEVRANRYYKLKYLGEGVAPTVEIDGIHMHNIVGTDPLSDARRKVALIGVREGQRVLDVCTGLGYTAIASASRGAEVTSIELDVNVLWLAEHNPFSRGLSRVEILLGNAYDVLDGLEDRSFDAVVHDPPTFAFAGELYGLDFYGKLYRVMKPGARLFHYTGAPGKHRGVDVQKGVAARLRAAGFRVERVIKEYGIVAAKPP
ncbi:MAG: methyltransferase domain-containing protein [Thermofilum sp.]